MTRWARRTCRYQSLARHQTSSIITTTEECRPEGERLMTDRCSHHEAYRHAMRRPSTHSFRRYSNLQTGRKAAKAVAKAKASDNDRSS